MRLGAVLFLILAIAFIIINTKPSGTHAIPIAPASAEVSTETTTAMTSAPVPIRRIIHTYICTSNDDDLDSISTHFKHGEVTQAKQQIMDLVLKGKARWLDANDIVRLLWSAGNVARVQPIKDTESGDRFACYVPLDTLGFQ